MASNSPNLAALRKLLRLVDLIGWIAVIVGLALAVYGLIQSLGSADASMVSGLSNLFGMGPGLLTAFLGLIAIAVSRSGGAAAYAAERIDRQAASAPAMKPVAPAAPSVAPAPPSPDKSADDDGNGAAETDETEKPAEKADEDGAVKPAHPRPEKGEERLLETYQGIEIHERYNGTYIGERWFANLSAAKAYIDVSKGS